MASTTPEEEPLIFRFTDSRWGTLAWKPGTHAMKHLSKVPVADMPKVTKLLTRTLKTLLKVVNDATCAAVNHKKRAEALVALETAEPLVTGGLSDKVKPSHPFHPGGGVGV